MTATVVVFLLTAADVGVCGLEMKIERDQKLICRKKVEGKVKGARSLEM